MSWFKRFIPFHYYCYHLTDEMNAIPCGYSLSLPGVSSSATSGSKPVKVPVEHVDGQGQFESS